MRRVDDTTLRVLYRGPLVSCNYECGYCPFAKRRDSSEALRHDAQALDRFVEWATAYPQPLAILFTPWGEGLVRKHYIEALVHLSHAPSIQRVAIQTNLSSNLRWVARADAESLALWCTYHPTQTTRASFLERLQVLRDAGVRFSVGIVGAHEHFTEIEAMRAALRPEEYLWINALDPRPPEYYTQDETAFLSSIDPHFSFNASPPPSLGAPCRAGSLSISVDGAGNVRPCHFLGTSLGNLYDGTFRPQRMSCSNSRCDCFIGYIHRTDLPVAAHFDQGAVERIWTRQWTPYSSIST